MHIAVGTYLAEKTAWSKGPEVGPCSSCFRNGSKSYQTHGTPGSRTSQSQRLEAAIGTTAPLLFRRLAPFLCPSFTLLQMWMSAKNTALQFVERSAVRTPLVPTAARQPATLAISPHQGAGARVGVHGVVAGMWRGFKV